MADSVALALPVYNEEANIENAIDDATSALTDAGLPWQIIVIDNASTDSTVEIVESRAADETRIRLIKHESNRQYSGSCATAIREADADIIAIMDSDGQVTAQDLPLFVEHIERGASLVLGWRKERKDPMSRLTASALFNAMGSYYLDFPLHDLNCGFRVFDSSFASVAVINHRINLVNPELYVRAVTNGLRVSEVPIRHYRREGGASSHDFRRSVELLREVNRYFRALRAEMRGQTAEAARPDASGESPPIGGSRPR